MADETLKTITLEQIEDLKAFLMGNPHGGLLMSRGHQPRLRQNAANGVIWYLQEVLRVLPDRYEMCDACGELYDQHASGHLGRKEIGTYCDNCDGD